MKNFKNYKIRIIIYLIIFILITSYMFWYTDNIYFHNIKKISCSFDEKVELLDFNRVVKIIAPDNYLNAKLDIVNGNTYLVLDGLKREEISYRNQQILKRNQIHQSKILALFSMGYLSDYFLKQLNRDALSDSLLNKIGEVYVFLHKEIANYFSRNPMTVNDHAISERIQFITLYRSYLEKYYPKKEQIIAALSLDFNICLNFLMSESHFTWQTNHGIMQLRSLAQIAGVVKNKKIKKKMLNTFNNRLLDIMPYFIGDDGAIYESASGYWYYIYNQFKKLSELESIQNMKSIYVLKKKLKIVEQYLNLVASNDGFMQGLGDSYSFYLDSLNNKNIPPNRMSSFSNQLVSLNCTEGSANLNLLFSSLDTPPNVHKLPEDLMVSLYINKPFFVNTGTFSYDNSAERKYFTEFEQAHSTVYFFNSTIKACDSSKIFFKPDIPHNEISFAGLKYYKGDKQISRQVNITDDSCIYITDISNSKDSILTQFNINPEVKLKMLSPNKLTLVNKDSISITLSANSKLNVKKGIISNKPQKLEDINQIQIIGDKIITKIKLNNFKIPLTTIKSITNMTYQSKRKYYSALLENKYKNNKGKNLKSMIIVRTVYLLLFFISSIFLIELIIMLYRKKK